MVNTLLGRDFKLKPYSDRSQAMMPCPYAKWRHPKGRDGTPSCVVSVGAKTSLFYCHTCQSKGNMLIMSQEIEAYEGRDLSELRKFISDTEDEGLLSRLDILDDEPEKVLRQDEVWDEGELDNFKGKVPTYVFERGVTVEVCKKFEVGYDEREKRLVFPVRRLGDSALVGMVGRALSGGPKYKNYWNFKKSNYLYGENLVGEGDLIVVEGMLDVLRLASLGVENVVGTFGAMPSKHQAEKIIDLCDDNTLTIIYDGDDSGDKGTRRLLRHLEDSVLVKVVSLEKGVDPGDLDSETLANAITQAKLVL